MNLWWHCLSYPFDLGQGMDGVLDGVSGDYVRVVSVQVILAWSECELYVSFQLEDGVLAPVSPDDQHLHRVFAIASSHKFHILHARKVTSLDRICIVPSWLIDSCYPLS